MKQTYKLVIIGLIFICQAIPALSQEKTRILFVFDASNSMNGYWEKERKIKTATRLLSESLKDLNNVENLELGLRVYGHQTKHIPGNQDCDDTELVVPISHGTNLLIEQQLNRITPQGTTPIARSLEKSAEDFTDCDDCRNIIILITDGIEACDEDPCAVSRALQAKGIILKPFIIGIGLDEMYKATFECVGNYFDATKEETFEQVLDIVITQALNNTTVQVDLLDIDKKPVETNIPVSIVNQDTEEMVYHFVHTLNSKGNPDTLTLDPLLTYRVTAGTYPPVVVSDLKVSPGQHNVLPLNTPQGSLNFTHDGLRSEYADLKCLVRKKGSCEVVNTQDYGSKEKYIVGEYDVTIQTVPPTVIEGVKVTSNTTTDINIPLPGTLLLQTGTQGFGGVFLIEDGKTEMVHKFTFGDPSGRYVMQPGKYKLIFRSKNAKQTLYSIEKEFEIRSGSNTNLRI